MRILITGGNGFIGKSIKENLNDKEYHLFSPSHTELDLLDRKTVTEYIQKKKIESVIHCAIKASPTFFQDSITMFANLLEHRKKLDKLIFFGTGAEYNKVRNLNKVNEEELGDILPTSDLGLAKYICNEISRRHANVINIRPFGVYGINENYLQAFISNSIAKSLVGLPITINQNVKFDYIYINDLSPVIEYFLKNDALFHDYNVTPNDSITLSEIIEIIEELSATPLSVKLLKPGMNFAYTGDNTRVKKELHSLTFTPYKDGIKKVYEYYQTNKDKISKNDLTQDLHLRRIKEYEASKKIH